MTLKCISNLCPLYFLSCYFFSHMPTVTFFPVTLFILLPKWTVTFFPVTFFPTCPLLLSFLLLYSYSYPKELLLSFLLLFFLLAHCYFLSCYFFSYLSTVTFFPVTFFPVTFFPTWNCYFLSCYLFSCYFLSVHQIMFPTRIAKRSYSLLDQIFCKVPCKEQADISASILLSGISDHFPCVVNFKILNKKPRPPRYVYKRSITESSLDQYRSDLRSLNIHTHLKADLMTDPNASYQIFENLMQKSYQRHFPEKRVKFNKYQHKLSNWITTGILKSIEFRDNLYKRQVVCSWQFWIWCIQT